MKVSDHCVMQWSLAFLFNRKTFSWQRDDQDQSAQGGFLVKPRQTPGGMIHFWGDFSLSFSAHHGGAVPQPGFTPAFAGILLPVRAGFFILRELAEFG